MINDYLILIADYLGFSMQEVLTFALGILLIILIVKVGK